MFTQKNKLHMISVWFFFLCFELEFLFVHKLIILWFGGDAILKVILC